MIEDFALASEGFVAGAVDEGGIGVGFDVFEAEAPEGLGGEFWREVALGYTVSSDGGEGGGAFAMTGAWFANDDDSAGF